MDSVLTAHQNLRINIVSQLIANRPTFSEKSVLEEAQRIFDWIISGNPPSQETITYDLPDQKDEG